MPDIKKQLLEIRDLLQSGLITQGEHDELRHKIIGTAAQELDKKSMFAKDSVTQTIVPMSGEIGDEEPMFLVPDLRDEDEGRWSSKTRPPIPNSEFPGLSYSEPISGREEGDLAEFADADDETSPFIRRVDDDFKLSDSLESPQSSEILFKFNSSTDKAIQSRLLVTEGLCNQQSIDLGIGELTIGRGRKCDVMIMNDPKASRLHCRVSFADGRYIIIDSESIHGTWINRTKITNAVDLKDGDEIRVGETVFIYRGE